MSGSFSIVGDEFQLNGEPYRVLSGALHYFRVPREYWADRIHKARQMGLNTIETYIPWNLHCPRRGQWVAEGNLDLAAFLDAIAAENMNAIVRPGPFICAEFNAGGLPGWLMTSPGDPVRCSDPGYLEPVLEYLRQVYQIVAPRQIDRAGSVILVQIENEYGAYGKDREYLQALTDQTRAAGITVPLTTVDQPRPSMLPYGTLPELLATASFGSGATERLRYLREVQPSGPLMCSEFWNGWFDQWGDYHHVTSAEAAASELREVLEQGASVNLYMFHGGTNFGFTNGANNKGLYRALVTSYDYDAPLDEAGQPTEKYRAFQKVLTDFTGAVPQSVPEAGPAPQPVAAEVSRTSLRSMLENAVWEAPGRLPSMDELGIYQGFLAYRAAIPATAEPTILSFAEVRDRAIVWTEAGVVGVIERMDGRADLLLPAGASQLTIVLEDQGRVNYGPRIGEAKGLIGPATVGGVPVTEWETCRLPFEDGHLTERLRGEPAAPGPLTEPTLLRFDFVVETPRDLFLDTSAWGKGLAWVNGFLLGRYWRRGPQRTLYVPGPLLRPGQNSLMVLELEPQEDFVAAFAPRADLGPIDW